MEEWITTEDGIKYKNITTNGAWEVVRFHGDMAVYSFCPYCGHTHPCYKNVHDKNGNFTYKIVYAPEKEYNYCPSCGARMLEELNDYFRND